MQKINHHCGSSPKSVNSRNPLSMMKMVTLDGKEPSTQPSVFFIHRPASAGIPEGRIGQPFYGWLHRVP